MLIEARLTLIDSPRNPRLPMASFARQPPHYLILVVGGLLFHYLATSWAQADHREGFESAETSWKLIQSDGRAEMRRQVRDLRIAHSGQASESMTVITQGGSYAYLAYDVPPARLIDELSASLWLNADRPGLQFAARIVLPHVKDERTGRPVTLLVHGDTYERVGSWQQLRLESLRRQFEHKRPALFEQYGRHIDLREPYLDRLLINAHGGKNVTNLWIDDIEVLGDIRPGLFAARAGPERVDAERHNGGIRAASANLPSSVDERVSISAEHRVSPEHDAVVRMNGSQILLKGRPWLPRITHWRDEPLTVLKSFGFNALWSDSLPDPEVLEQAQQLDLWFIVPCDGLLDPRHFAHAVIAWVLPSDSRTDLSNLRAQREQVATAARRPIVVPESLAQDSEPGEVIWVDRFSDPAEAIQVGRPVWMTTDIDIQQVDRTRRQAYEAIAAGARGLIFQRPDLIVTRDRTRERFEIPRLQREIAILEPWIAGGHGCEKLPFSSRDWNCFALTTPRSRLVVAIQSDAADGARQSLRLVDPGSSPTADAYLLREDGLSTLRRHRVAGGVRAEIVAPEPINIMVFTEDPLTVNYLGRSTAESARFTATSQGRR